MRKPTVAITMGDPAGIGPEIVVKLLSGEAVYERCTPFVIGDLGVMRGIARTLGSPLDFHPVDRLEEMRFAPGTVDVLSPPRLQVGPVAWGQLSAAMGEAATSCMRYAFELAMRGQVQGVVLAPINKEAFHLAGYDYFDEAAYLTELTGSRDSCVMGSMGTVWTTALSEHVPFTEILSYVRKDRALSRIHRLRSVLQGVLGREPRLAVAALNVHGGEGGLFGREEIDIIEPAVREAQAAGVTVSGPIPADTVFVRALAGEFDGVVCMYHDQANIARKLQPHRGPTVFVGLPVPCATTAHGTAFDKAGQGIADPESLRSALDHVVMLSRLDLAQA